MTKKSLTGLIILVTVLIGTILYWPPQKLSTEFFSSIEEVTLGLPKESLAALTIIAQENGYFTQHGVRVTVKEYKGGKQALVDGVLAGKVDIAATADVPIVFNSFHRNDFKIVATIASSDNEPGIIARKDKHILHAHDLRGKKITTKKGSAVHYFLNVFLAHNGISENNVNITFAKDGAEMVTALVKGEIDAFSHREPFISEAKKRLGNNTIVFKKPGAYVKTFNLVTSNNMIEKKPEAIKRMLKALLIAEEFAIKYPNKSIKLVARYIGIPEESLSDTWEDINFKIALDQSLIQTLKAQARWALSSKLIAANKAPDYFNYIYFDAMQAVKPEAVHINAAPSNTSEKGDVWGILVD